MSRNAVNKLENTTSINLRDAIRNLKVIGDKPDKEIANFDKERDRVDLVFQLRQAFIEIDDNHNGLMSFDEFVRGNQWVGVKASENKLRKAFAT
eukprot:UN10684